jgi:hypothetical protein
MAVTQTLVTIPYVVLMIVIMSVVFGRRATWDDPELAALFETAEEFLALQQPGVNIVDAFPSLSKLPKFLQWWRPRGEKIHEKTVGYPSQIHNLTVIEYIVEFLRLWRRK